MKFKTKEDLKKYSLKYSAMNTSLRDGYETGIEQAFHSFAERVDTYVTYRENPRKFCQDHPKNKQKGLEFMRLPEWKDWLFDHCFGDIE